MSDSRSRPMGPAAVVILAAGEGTRMKSKTPKVLHPLCGQTMLGHVLTTASAIEPAHLVVVVGHGRDRVSGHVTEIAPRAKTVVQEHQRGTGHAVRVAIKAVGPFEGTTVVLYGDTPLLRPETIRALIETHQAARDAVTVLTASLDDPTGYGRVIRDETGGVAGIVEDKDATPRQRAIKEINSGVYAFDGARLAEAVSELSASNAQGEEYLTDAFAQLRADHGGSAIRAVDPLEVMNINDRVQLAEARRLLNRRILEHHMRTGVTIVDPATTWIDRSVTAEPDAVVHPNTQLSGATHISADASVGPGCTLRDTFVGVGASVINAVCEGAEVGPEASVGPYTYLRPGTRLGRKAKAGGFVEMKSATVGDESKVPHLSYVGDAEIGEGSNIGAATVFVNYDGVEKHHTRVGDHVRIGSDTMLVAPVEVDDGAYTAAGSVITNNVPPGAMGIARGRQRNVQGWVERRRAGTKSAEAARRTHEVGRRAQEEGPSRVEITGKESGAEQEFEE